LIALVLLRTGLFRRHALWSCDLTGFLLLTRPCRCYVFRYNDLGGLTRFCRSHALWYKDLTGKFLLTLFCRRRMFGYDHLAYLTCLCRCHVLGHHDMTRMSGLCRCHITNTKPKAILMGQILSNDPLRSRQPSP